MNEIENDYIPLGMPNILFENRKNVTNNTEVTADNTLIHPFMLPLMKRLAQARPRWKFVADRRSMANTIGTTGFHVTKFDVYEGSAKLGRIWNTYGSHGDVICIDNDRMSKGRQRVCYTSTQDLKKAFKLITKNFHGPTIDELVNDTLTETKTVVGMLESRHRREFYSKYRGIANFLEDYTINNWEHTKQLAIDAGVSPTALDGMTESYQAKLVMDEIAVSLGTGAGATVMLRGDEYIVVINGVTNIFDTDHLPSHIKRSLGILKMVENHTYVEGHGVRVNKDKFFISSKEGIAS